MLDFRLGAKRACQLTARIDGIDRAFLFGNARIPCSHQGCSLFPSRLGTILVSWGLALVFTDYFIVYIGVDTVPVSSGTDPATLTPRWGVENLLLCAVKVSTYLNTLDIDYDDITEGDLLHPGIFRGL
jgi:hypothetical protein